MIETRKSIVLVTVDCLRSDHVGFMGYTRPTTPFLDRLANEGFVFPAAIVAGAPTYYSLPAILASRYPLALGRDVLGVGPGETTLVTVLKKAGYATAAFSAANPYIASRFGYGCGFDVFRDFQESGADPIAEEVTATSQDGWAGRINRKLQGSRAALGPLGVIYDELYFRYCQRITPAAKSLDELRKFPAADVIVDHACKWLGSVGKAPFFLWLHLMDPHAPYYPKEDALAFTRKLPITPARARYLNSYWNRGDLGPRRLARHYDEVVGLYDAGIRWVDAQMKRLIEFLQQANLWNDCVFALTADHGEEFLDHGGRFHPPSRLMEELIRVPLLLRVPAAPKREVARWPFSLLHLAPTLLECVQVSIPDEFRGRSCWQQLQQGGEFGGAAVSECVAGCTNPFRPENRVGPRILSVREARFKLILRFDPLGEEFYDLEADPRELAPLATTAEKPVRRHLLERAREHIKRSYSERDDGMRMRARLQSLRLEWTNPADKAPAVAS